MGARLESEGEFERAAAIACFTQNTARAVDILQKGATARMQRSAGGGNPTPG